jgi:hypothetical protein
LCLQIPTEKLFPWTQPSLPIKEPSNRDAFPESRKSPDFDQQNVRRFARSGPKIIRLPVPDELFDGLAIVELFVEDFAGQRGQFGVTRKPQ